MIRILIVICLIVVYATASSSTFNIIAGSPTTKKRSLSVDQLIDIFTRKTTKWEDRSEIIVVTYKISSIPSTEFLIDVLGITPYQYKSRLRRNLLDKGTSIPIEVDSEEEMLMTLTNTPNSIGYMYDYMLYVNEDKLVIIDVVP